MTLRKQINPSECKLQLERLLNWIEDERHNLAREIQTYLEMVGYEQGLRVDQSLPTLEEYWRLRMATSAVKITTACLLLVPPPPMFGTVG
jgi:hypothetical protein